MYKLLLNNLHQEGKFPYHIEKAGYAVIKKRPVKINDRVCTKCGHKSAGRHDTCDNVIDGKRCKGDWNSTLKVSFETQFIVDDISHNQEELVLDVINGVNSAINAGMFQPNLNSCIGKYGRCAFYEYCHNNKSMDGLYIEEKKDESSNKKEEPKNG